MSQYVKSPHVFTAASMGPDQAPMLSAPPVAIGDDGQPQHSSSDGPMGLIRNVSMLAMVYHGYKRNDSVLWAVLWGGLASFFPLITPAVAVAQGFGQPKKRLVSNPSKRRRAGWRRRAARRRRSSARTKASTAKEKARDEEMRKRKLAFERDFSVWID